MDKIEYYDQGKIKDNENKLNAALSILNLLFDERYPYF